MRRLLPLVFAGTLALQLFAGAARAYDVEVIEQNGDPANRVDIAILGDGYRVEDQTKLTTDVNSFLTLFWQRQPFGEYRRYFNVKLVHVISNEIGADNGTYGVTRDTALGAYYNCNNIDRLLCVNTGTVFSVAASHVPEYDYIFVIVNDPKYGGAGGSIAVFSVHSSAPEIALHEFGHTQGALADEYEDAYPGYPGCGSDCPEPNVTNHNTRETVKWNSWIDAATPVPTPETSQYGSVIGVFEGARYQTSGVYRPKQNCQMRALGQQFCSVCGEAIILRIYNKVDPIDATSPPSPVSLGPCDTASFTYTHPEKPTDTFLATWTLDGQAYASGVNTLDILASSLGPGAHTLRLDVADETPSVRRDPSNLLFDSYTWTINVSSAGNVCLIGGQCLPAGTVDPSNPCRECIPTQNPSGFSPDDTNTCDDNLFCNGAERCLAGSCVRENPPCADDGLACTQDCDEDADACHVLLAGNCLIGGACFPDGAADPQNPCRECASASDPSHWTNDDQNSCNDGVFCNGEERCAAGVCQAGTNPCADDGLACTRDCDEDADACHVLLDGSCLIGGVCYADGATDPQNPCRKCSPSLGPLTWSDADGALCDDGDPCTANDRCRGGACVAGENTCADGGTDAGPDGSDAGADAGSDAGSDAGDGAHPPIVSGGCGCAGAGAPGGDLAPLLALLLIWLSPRRPSRRTGRPCRGTAR
ncbi:MAG: hypothetical protein GYA21_00405 [Myxococcales bacterium]|nr:hypothetical protein [Myxococcales bacterium]